MVVPRTRTESGPAFFLWSKPHFSAEIDHLSVYHGIHSGDRTLSMKKSRTWRIDNPVYNYTLHLRHAGTLAESNKWARRILGGGDFSDGEIFGRTYIDECRKDHVIWISQGAGAATVAHEALHSVTHVATLLGFPHLNQSTDEPYCYLLGWTVAEIGTRIWK